MLDLIQKHVTIKEQQFSFKGRFLKKDAKEIRSAIQEAEKTKLEELIKLKDQGADLNYVREREANYGGWEAIYKETALSLALEGPVYPSIIKWLLENGAKPNAEKIIVHKKREGVIEKSTPLMQLAKVWVSRNVLDGRIAFPGDLYSDDAKCLSAVCIDLLDYGADVTLKDHTKKTVTDQLNKVFFGFEKPVLDILNNFRKKPVVAEFKNNVSFIPENSGNVKNQLTDVEKSVISSNERIDSVDDERIGIKIALPKGYIDKRINSDAKSKECVLPVEEKTEDITPALPVMPTEKRTKPFSSYSFGLFFNKKISYIAMGFENILTKSSTIIGNILSKIKFW